MIHKLQDPALAIVNRLKRLEAEMDAFKAQAQSSTILVSEASTVSFSNIYDDFLNAGGGLPSKNIKATLHSPSNARLMAIPEFSLFWATYAVPSVDDGSSTLVTADRQFPSGNRFANFAATPAWFQALLGGTPAATFGRVHLDLNYWYDWLWSFADGQDEVAYIRLRIDAALQNQTFPAGQFTADWTGNGFTLMQWWRYLNAGATPA